jgi:hypothetical protein
MNFHSSPSGTDEWNNTIAATIVLIQHAAEISALFQS